MRAAHGSARRYSNRTPGHLQKIFRRSNSRKVANMLWRHTYYEQRTMEEDAGYANKLKRVVEALRLIKVSASEMTTKDGESA